MVKIIIVDDEMDARSTLVNYLKKYCPQTELLGEAGSVKEAAELIRARQPDLLLLDIQMADGTGFELLDKIKERNFDVIFITAYNDFALQAFRYSAADYLLKPIDPDEFCKSIEKYTAKEKNGSTPAGKKNLDVLLNNMKNPLNPKIAVADAKGITFVNFDDIVWCRSNNNYTVISLKDKSQLVATRSLKEFEEMLEGLPCFRIHNTSLINMNHISRYIRGEGGFVVMADKTELEVSRRKKPEFLEKLGQMQKS